MYRCISVALALTACGVEPTTSTSRDPMPDGGVVVVGDAARSDDGGTVVLTACEEATQHSDLAWIQRAIFDVSCLSGCHGAASPAAGLDLRAGQSRASLVEVPSTQFSGWIRVVPR